MTAEPRFPAYTDPSMLDEDTDTGNLLQNNGTRGVVDIIAINYAPEVTGIAPYVTDMARRLVERGWSVRVVTGLPHYPEWKVDSSAKGLVSTSVVDGVMVSRIHHSVPSTTGLPPRARMEFEFGIKAIQCGVRPEAVVVLVSPPLIAAGLVAAWERVSRHKNPIGIWVHDLYSQAVSEAAEGRAVTRWMVRRLESFVLRSADQVAVVHNRFRRSLVEGLGVDDGRISEIRNWNQAQPPTRIEKDIARRRLGIAADQVVAIHAGNMGVKQGLENVVSAARVADERETAVRFYLIGHGNQRAELERAATGIGCIRFVDPLPDEAFHTYLSAADVLLVNEKVGVSEMSVPSKLTTYFSYGLPVVAAVDANGVTAAEVMRSGGGTVVPSGDPEALVAEVIRVSSDDSLSRRLGDAGLAYSRANLDVAAAVEGFEYWLQRLLPAQAVGSHGR